MPSRGPTERAHAIMDERAQRALLLRVFTGAPPRTLLIAAHPDDETIGASAALARLGTRATVAYATDGAPADGCDARACGFADNPAYAAARLHEAAAALAVAGVTAPPRSLGFGDQQAAHRLADLARAIKALIVDTAPELILTHAFEGGHPDHDAVAFATHSAARRRGVVVAEFTGYHSGANGIETGCFAGGGDGVIDHSLSAPERARKEAMVACFETQRPVLAQFGRGRELYRIAPCYEFALPPCGGAVHYDRHEWGLRSAHWPVLVKAAQAQLEATPCCAS